MTRKTAVLAIAAMALSLPAVAQMPDPTVLETQFAIYDLSNLKAGDWVEFEVDQGGQKFKTKTACVRIEGDTLWVEYSDMAIAMMHPGSVVLVAINKGDRKVTKAWWGKAGSVGKELSVQKPPTAPQGADTPAPTPTPTMTGKVGKETIKVLAEELPCEKLEVTTTMSMGGQTMTMKSTVWTSEKVPFRQLVDEMARAAGPAAEMKWEGGKPEGKGGLVKMTSESQFGTMSMTLTGMGSDAKPALKTP